METGPSAWWDQSWNPTAGCAPVDPDCANCYAAKQAGTIHQRAGAKREVRLLYDGITDLIDGRPVFNGRTTRLPPGHPSWVFPLIYPGAYRPVLGPNRPSLIFVGDMSDLFFRQPTRIIHKVVGTIAASRHIGLLLTGRPGRMRAYFTAPRTPLTLRRQQDCLWLGASAGFQAAFDARWPHLRTLAERGWLVFISVAPLREAVRLPPDLLALGDRAWVIVAGEQGAHSDCRDLNANWARAIRDQCANAGVAFFFKQLSRKAAIPIDLMIRQFPRVERPPCW
jgi:protein gp37